MNMEIKMPRLGTNDDYVSLAQWLVKNGDNVEQNQIIAVIETTKETSELKAPKSGYIELVASSGRDTAVGEVIATIHDTLDTIHLQDASPEYVEERKFSDKALKLIKEYNIDVKLLPSDRIIRERDVRNLISNPYTIMEIDSHKVLIYGGGGFCKVILDILKQRGEYQIVGILDRKYPKIEEVKGIPVIENSDFRSLQSLYQKGYRKIINAVGFDGKKHGRKAPYEMMKQIGYECVNVIHNRSILEVSVTLGEGNLVAAGAIIGTDARIGNNCIINAGAIISHDCIISDNCHIASGAVLGGNVIVGENTLIGQGCTIFKDIRIGSNVVVQNGANVVRDIPNNTFVEA